MVLGLGILQLYNRRIGNLSEACVYLLEFGAKKVKTNCKYHLSLLTVHPLEIASGPNLRGREKASLFTLSVISFIKLRNRS